MFLWASGASRCGALAQASFPSESWSISIACFLVRLFFRVSLCLARFCLTHLWRVFFLSKSRARGGLSCQRLCLAERKERPLFRFSEFNLPFSSTSSVERVKDFSRVDVWTLGSVSCRRLLSFLVLFFDPFFRTRGFLRGQEDLLFHFSVQVRAPASLLSSSKVTRDPNKRPNSRKGKEEQGKTSQTSEVEGLFTFSGRLRMRRRLDTPPFLTIFFSLSFLLLRTAWTFSSFSFLFCVLLPSSHQTKLCSCLQGGIPS